MKKNSYGNPPVVFTIGHSTRALEEFTSLLCAPSITMVVDIRTIPRSGHNPQFNKETLPDSLYTAGIGYKHMLGLGGLRHARKDSPNTGWHNLSFRGFADYMQTEEFEKNLEELIHLAKSEKIVLMCAEVVQWRCHRSLIADALLVHGISVEHIISMDRRIPHSLTSFALVNGIHITYPPAGSIEKREVNG
ncbi:MAG TPA: DUF488 domain-containing protein [Candidatus Methanoperedens sp.]